jgi:SAM-dependent methyltransferase
MELRLNEPKNITPETSNEEIGGTPPARTNCPACESPRVLNVVQVPDHEYGLDYVATYARCGTCDSLYQVPMPSDAELASFYRQNYHSMTDGGILMLMRHKMRIRRLKGLLKGVGAVLDYGCGNGSFMCRAAAAIPRVEFIGYEIGDGPLVTRPRERVTIVQGKPEDLIDILPICQVMIMNHVIEHLPDPFAIISALARKLAPGGVFDGQTPNATSLEHRIFGRRWSGFHAPRHTVVFSTAGLRGMLERIGFEGIRITGAFNPAGYAVSFAGLPHGDFKGLIPRHGWKWLLCVAAASVVLPIDVGSGAPGMIDFKAKKKGRD